MGVLPSWCEGATRDAIVSFLYAAGAIPIEDRTAVLDHDGTLRCEKPTFMLFDFLVHEVRAAVAARPDMADRPDYRLLLEGDPAAIANFGMRRCVTAVYELASGLTPEEFVVRVRDFVRDNIHADRGVGYRQLVYQPMQELIEALRSHDFTVFLNVLYGIEFVRAISREFYGIPPECVIGTLIDYRYEDRGGGTALVRTATIPGQVRAGATNVMNIQTQTGRRPIVAAGNSIGDREALDYALASDGPSLALLIDHDDAVREYAYQEHVVTLAGSEPIVELAHREGWTVVSMRADWATVFPPSSQL